MASDITLPRQDVRLIVGSGVGQLEELANLRRYVERLAVLSDSDWLRYMYTNSSNRRQVQTAASLKEAVDRLQETAEDTAKARGFALQGEVRPWKLLNPHEEIGRYGVTIEAEAPGPLDESFIHFAVYDPLQNRVEVSERAMSTVEELIDLAEIADCLGGVSLKEVVLWHEYYHVWMHHREKQDRASGRRRVWHGLKSRFTRPVRPTQVSHVPPYLLEELSAILFSKMACGMTYNPQVLQWLLMYTVVPERAVVMAQDILEKSVMK